MPRSADRAGFTLVEILAALTVSGLALLGGLALLDQTTDGSARISHRAQVIGRESNGLRLLHQLLLDARVTGDTASRFRGDERSIDFSSVCQSPSGWMEACRVSLAIDRRHDSSFVVAELSTGTVLDLSGHRGAAELRYLDPLQSDSSWMRRWALGLTMPIGVGLVVDRDTIVYPVGAARD